MKKKRTLQLVFWLACVVIALYKVGVRIEPVAQTAPASGQWERITPGAETPLNPKTPMRC